jgi:hypothetical protein
MTPFISTIIVVDNVSSDGSLDALPEGMTA